MPNFGLEVAIAKMIDDIIPDDVVRQERAVKGVVSEDATVLPEALANLPWQRSEITIPGAATTMSNAARIPFPQGGQIRHISIFARSAPSSVYQIQIQAADDFIATSLQAGQTVSMTSALLHVPANSWVAINVTNAGGAADVYIVLHYTTSATSSTSGTGSGASNGGSGGGGSGAVDSVNGKTGAVVLNADDIDDTSTSHKFVSADDLTKLANLSGVNTGDQDLSGYALASSLSLVATSGDYDDLDNKPTIPAQFNPIAGTNVTISGTYPNITFNASGGGGGGGDMAASTYDPTGVADDAFDMDNMVEGTTTKIMTDTERAKLAGIENGAEVNVQSDWDATSGDAAILNKPDIPVTFRQYGFSGGISADATGTIEASSAALVFGGLNPSETYEVDWTVSMIIQSTAAGNNRAAPGVRVTHGGGTSDAFYVSSYIDAPTIRGVASWRWGGAYTADAGGEITVVPILRWSTGRFDALNTRIAVTVSG